MRALAAFLCLALLACASGPSNKAFSPKSDYPNDPWVKGYSDPDDCIGGEKLAARNFSLPAYPRKAFRKGAQGWVLLRLDVDAAGETTNIRVERALPDRYFSRNAKRAAQNWQFQAPKGGPLQNCRVLLRYKLGGVNLGG